MPDPRFYKALAPLSLADLAGRSGARLSGRSPSELITGVAPLAKATRAIGGANMLRALPDGSIFINDVQRRQLLRFDPTLQNVVVVADTAPGALMPYGQRPIGLLPYLGDSSIVVDPATLSMVVLNKDGKTVRVMASPRTNDVNTLSNMNLGSHAFDQKGRLYYRQGNAGGGPGGGGSNSGSGRSGNSGHGSSNSGSGNSGSGGVEIDDSTGVPVSSKRSGFGDVVISATYSFDLGSDFYIDATGKVKVPTASTAKRLGTGEVDVTTGLDFVKSIGPATFYVHGRRKFAGKPTGSLIRSTWGAGGGASIKAGKAITLGADYDWQESAFAGNPANSDVTAWASARLNSKMNLSIFGSTGLNSNSADFAGGIGLSIKLN